MKHEVECMEEKTNNKKLLLGVAFDEEKNVYSVDVPAGSNVAETAFAMAVVIKCLVRDGIIENHKIVTDMINKYLTESQYEEISE